MNNPDKHQLHVSGGDVGFDHTVKKASYNG